MLVRKERWGRVDFGKVQTRRWEEKRIVKNTLKEILIASGAINTLVEQLYFSYFSLRPRSIAPTSGCVLASPRVSRLHINYNKWALLLREREKKQVLVVSLSYSIPLLCSTQTTFSFFFFFVFLMRREKKGITGEGRSGARSRRRAFLHCDASGDSLFFLSLSLRLVGVFRRWCHYS